MEKLLKRPQWELFILCLMMMMMMKVSCEKGTFFINSTWDGKETGHNDIVIHMFSEDDDFITLKINAPYFHDPPPPNGESGKPFNKLWDYEVVEAFFLGKDEKYVELEFSPHGEHLVLLLSGRGNAIKKCLPLDYVTVIKGNAWEGFAKVPKSYFPPEVTRFNAYAIHGCGENRIYEALYPVPTNQFDYPDFHRIEFFRDHSDFFKSLLSRDPDTLSNVWKQALVDAGEL